METLFTERQAIEIAYKNLENEKKERRAEMRADIQKIDDRLFFIMERIKAIDEKDEKNGIVFQPNQPTKPTEPEITFERTETLASAPTMETVEVIREKKLEQKTKQPKPKPIPNPKPKPKTDILNTGTPKPNRTRKTNQATPTKPEDGVEMLVSILGAEGKPMNATSIGKALSERFGKDYANPHGQIKLWMEHTNKIQKIGTKYSLVGQPTI